MYGVGVQGRDLLVRHDCFNKIMVATGKGNGQRKRKVSPGPSCNGKSISIPGPPVVLDLTADDHEDTVVSAVNDLTSTTSNASFSPAAEPKHKSMDVVSTPFGMGFVNRVFREGAFWGKEYDGMESFKTTLGGRGMLGFRLETRSEGGCMVSELKKKQKGKVKARLTKALRVGDVVTKVGSLTLKNETAEEVEKLLEDRKRAIVILVSRDISKSGRRAENLPLSYEVCLCWGDFELRNGKCWMPKAYLGAESVSRDSSKSFDYVKNGAKKRKTVMRVMNEDLVRLWPGVYLNDTLIDFYLAFVLEKLAWDVASRFHVMSSMFLSHLLRNVGTKNKLAKLSDKDVRRWTKNTDLFAKDFLIIPINNSDHWSLAIVVNPGQLDKKEVLMDRWNKIELQLNTESSNPVRHVLSSIVSLVEKDDKSHAFALVFDSLKHHRTQTSMKMIRKFLEIEWQARHVDSELKVTSKVLPVITASTPIQINSCDCGVYILEFAERLMEDATLLDHLAKEKDLDHVRTRLRKDITPNWFTPSEITHKRKRIWTIAKQLRDNTIYPHMP